MGKSMQMLAAPEQRKSLCRDLVELIDEEVRARSGISGLALQGAYKLVRATRPGFMEDAVAQLLPPCAEALEDLVQGAGQLPLESHFRAHREEVADALLAVTDARAGQASAAVRRAYEKLRPSAKRNVEEVAPRLGALLDRHFAEVAGEQSPGREGLSP